MSIHAATWDHRLFVLVAVGTHAVVGYALGTLFGRGRLGAAAGVAPDLDLACRHGWPYPFVHRGLLHTPLVLAGLAVAVAVATRSRRAGAVVGVAGGSHLLVDSLTATGVPWLYPLSNRRYGLALDVHDAAGTVALLALAAGLLAVGQRRHRSG